MDLIFYSLGSLPAALGKQLAHTLCPTGVEIWTPNPTQAGSSHRVVPSPSPVRASLLAESKQQGRTGQTGRASRKAEKQKKILLAGKINKIGWNCWHLRAWCVLCIRCPQCVRRSDRFPSVLGFLALSRERCFSAAAPYSQAWRR